MSTSTPAPQGFQMVQWIDRQVMPSIVPLLPNKEHDWPAFQVALRAAVLKSRQAYEAGQSKTHLMKVLQDNPDSGPQSLLLSMIKCAQLGMSLNPAMQHFALIPYGGVVEGQAMYRGYLHLALSSGKVRRIEAEVVYAAEKPPPGVPFVDPVTGRVNHTPDPFGRDEWKDTDIVGAYAFAEVLGDPRPVVRVLSRKDIEKRRAKGQGNSPAYRDWYREMCLAKVTKALLTSGRVPLQPDQLRQLQAEEEEVVVPVAATVLPTAPAAPPRPAPPPADPLFAAADKEPFPSEEELCGRLRGAIETEVLARDLPAEKLAALVAKALGKPGDVAKLGSADLQVVLAALEAE